MGIMKTIRYIITVLLVLNLSGALYGLEPCSCVRDHGECTCSEEHSSVSTGEFSCCDIEISTQADFEHTQDDPDISGIVFKIPSSSANLCASGLVAARDAYISVIPKETRSPITANDHFYSQQQYSSSLSTSERNMTVHTFRSEFVLHEKTYLRISLLII